MFDLKGIQLIIVNNIGQPGYFNLLKHFQIVHFEKRSTLPPITKKFIIIILEFIIPIKNKENIGIIINNIIFQEYPTVSKIIAFLAKGIQANQEYFGLKLLIIFFQAKEV